MSIPSPHSPSSMPPPQVPSTMIIQQPPPLPSTQSSTPLGPTQSPQQHSQTQNSLTSNQISNTMPHTTSANNQFNAINSHVNGSGVSLQQSQSASIGPDCAPHQHPVSSVQQTLVQVNLKFLYMFCNYSKTKIFFDFTN